MTANLHNLHPRCPKCGRSYHKTDREPNQPYTPDDERLIIAFAMRGFSAGRIAAIINDYALLRVGPSAVMRNAQNIREKARHMGIKLVAAINWRNQHGQGEHQ